MRNTIRFVLALVGFWLVGAPATRAFEPMPPIMRTLLEIFPEKNGWFVDEPLVAVPGTPDEAKPFFECFRVVVPDLESLDKAIGRLTANAPKLPIKKITRYDREAGAPGLAGFRGIWCKTEDEALVGFAIVTVNQNRFLLWAKQGYYPSFAVDSINAKVRDQYARDVSRYLAGVDAKVPDNEAPQATGRMLPEWVDLYQSDNSSSTFWTDSALKSAAEIRSWGFRNAVAIVPTPDMIDTIIATAPEIFWTNEALNGLQRDFASFAVERPLVFSRHVFDSLTKGQKYHFVVDRFGRMRIFADDEGPDDLPRSLYFPGADVLSMGIISIHPVWDTEGGQDPTRVAGLNIDLGPYVPRESVESTIEAHLRSLGHALRVLRDQGIPLTGIWIAKFWPFR